MALALSRDNIRQEIQHYLGHGRVTFGSLNTSSQGMINVIMQRGLRQFFAPPPVPGEATSHEWSFMKKIAYLTLKQEYATGTIAYDHTGGASERLVALSGTGAAFPSWAADTGVTIVIEDRPYDVVSVSAGNKITLAATTDASNPQNPGADVAAGTSYSLRPFYLMPADFGGIEGDFTFAEGQGKGPIRIINEAALRDLKQSKVTSTGTPQFAAIRPCITSSPTSTTTAYTQPFEVIFHPDPDEAYVLEYKYNVAYDGFDVNASGSDTIMPGLAVHHETILASCLAIAQMYVDEPNPGRYQQAFMERLISSVYLDRKQVQADFYGYNQDNSDSAEYLHRYRDLKKVTYDATLND